MLLQKRQELVGNSSKAPEESFDATVHWAFLGVGTAWKQRTHIYDFEKRRFVYRISCL